MSQKKNNINIPDWFYDDIRNIEVAKVLLNHVIKNVKKRKSPILTYKDLANRVGCGLTPRTIERFLGNISTVCKENGLPYVSGIVVNGETQIPGVGYYHFFYGINKNDFDSQIEQYKVDYKNIMQYKHWDELLCEIEG